MDRVQVATMGGGKTTFIKQMQVIHGYGYSNKDRAEYCSLVYRNIFRGMQILIEAMAVLEIAYANPNNKVCLTCLYCMLILYPNKPLQKYESTVMAVDVEEATEITVVQKVAIQSLWKDFGVERCSERRNEFQIADSAK